MRKKSRWNQIVIVASVLLIPLFARAQGTAFTYQGYLDASGAPHDGLADFEFSLWDTVAGGAQQGSTLTEVDVDVENGLFTVELDFGDQFPGATRWLEIAVRTNAAAYTTLTPRQQLTATPYAITADRVTGPLPASQLSGAIPSSNLSGTYSSAVTFNNAANTFAGDGSGLSDLDASELTSGTVPAAALDNAWKIGGNTGTTPGTHFVGTADNQALEFHVNNTRALRMEPNTAGAPNMIGGASVNFVGPGVIGATIGGGGAVDHLGSTHTNRVLSNFGTIGGGQQNTASGTSSTVGGGRENLASGSHSTIGGGAQNTANFTYTTIGGGQFNTASFSYATVGGGQLNRASDQYTTIGGGQRNTANGAYATVGGGWTNTASGLYATVGGGRYNIASFRDATVGGGGTNTASASGATVSGGVLNTANEIYSTVGGGLLNTASSDQATVGGGYTNTASGFRSTVGGGDGNHASNEWATVGGGLRNNAGGSSATVAGGLENSASASGSFIGGGENNSASGSHATVGGGATNTASGSFATVGGGTRNMADRWSATIGGGWNNTADGEFVTVGGGWENTASYVNSTVGGGAGNTADDHSATVGGGMRNKASSISATVSGGYTNTASGFRSTVGGGAKNTASHSHATVPGGYRNVARGNYSFAAGHRAVANHTGTFVWGDSTDNDLYSLSANSVNMRASGGYVFWSSSNFVSGVILPAGGNSWASTSDRELKENFDPVDPGAVLAQLVAIPITSWNYKADSNGRRYIGPMAQDFHAAFDLGDDKTISMYDATSVALTAIQGLNQKVEDEVTHLRNENQLLRERLDQLERLVTDHLRMGSL